MAQTKFRVLRHYLTSLRNKMVQNVRETHFIHVFEIVGALRFRGYKVSDLHDVFVLLVFFFGQNSFPPLNRLLLL